jgi:hypothetical protein
MRRFCRLVGLVSLTVLGAAPVTRAAAIPLLINIQGILRDGSGAVLPNTSKLVAFTIYDAPSGGNIKWTETTSLTTDAEGAFTYLLGSVTPIPDTVFADSARWLGTRVFFDPEMQPRSRLTSVPYSYVANMLSKPQEPWTDATLLNGWVIVAHQYAKPGYFRDKNGIVHLRGGANGTFLLGVMFNLPVGYRPEKDEIQPVASGSQTLNLYIAASGDVTILGSNPNTNDLHLDGVNFRAFGY